MSLANLDPSIFAELQKLAQSATSSAALPAQSWIDEQTTLFRDNFGPAVLERTDGEPLLQLMHGRQNPNTPCMAYWLEFKQDEQFKGNEFGGIRGGSSFKFGIYQRDADGAWITGSPKGQNVLSVDRAIEIARKQRKELIDAANVLARFDPADASGAVYERLDIDMRAAAPTLCGAVWAHKYWFLNFPDKIDGYHSPRVQRYHLLKLLQLPADNIGLRNNDASLFVCAGQFVQIARALVIPVAALCILLNQRNGGIHRYWRVGTTIGTSGDSVWPEMRDGGYVSIGWVDEVFDLTADLAKLSKSALKEAITKMLLPGATNAGVAKRKAGEITNFASSIKDNDIVVATEGNTIRGIGRVTGAYQYDDKLRFPHTRAVEWLSLDEWNMPEIDGPRTTVFELGKNPNNIIKIERRLSEHPLLDQPTVSAPRAGTSAEPNKQLPPLDPFEARIDGNLRRKGQVVLYGPPGTGKTYRALRVARELAARHAFGKTWDALDDAGRQRIDGEQGFVRMCTFHPGWGYEDFVEGLRPRVNESGTMVFEPDDGVFKRLCKDAARAQGQNFFLVIDEINRGDLPRIFGELLTTIELDKRDTRVILPVTRAPFSVPRNVFIVGTMNTADRSISLLDVALRRRFGFVELMPDSSLLKNRRVGRLALDVWLDALNKRLRRHLKRDARNLQIGQAYLLSSSMTSVSDFARVLRDDIIPLLEEYCYDDFSTLKDIIGHELVDVDNSRIREELFLPNRDNELIDALSFSEMQVDASIEDDDEPVDSDEGDADAADSE
ncbi:AAA family ATPase [Paraburkholderia tropica]|uniref:AAA family ATPase n=1 Tax=Paraburkholderia tropica TaxID=92647 RepID=UPI001CB49149|nr:AAA family ATPase [Paraburkholderia tropica]CAG9238171.1 AAA family ATPase [Paraburkholderia tropica]